MLDIILIVVCGKYFKELAENHDKNKWLYTILGIVSFYAVYILTAFFYGVFYALMYPESIDQINAFYVSILAYVVGGVGAGVLYYLLYRSWSKEQKAKENPIDTIGRDKS